jgi:hypothetical protein
MACPDREVVVGRGQLLFRIDDLLGLADLMARLSAERRGGGENEA